MSGSSAAAATARDAALGGDPVVGLYGEWMFIPFDVLEVDKMSKKEPSQQTVLKLVNDRRRRGSQQSFTWKAYSGDRAANALFRLRLRNSFGEGRCWFSIPGEAPPTRVGHRNFYFQVNDFLGHSHGQNIRQLLGMMSRYPLLAARVLEMEHTNKLADRALLKKAANKKRKAGSGSACGSGEVDAAGSGSACGSGEVDAAGPYEEVDAAGPYEEVDGGGAGSGVVDAAGPYEEESVLPDEDLFMDWDAEPAVEDTASAPAFVPTIEWAGWEARRYHWRVFNGIFTDEQVPLQLRHVVRFEDFV